MFKTKIAIITVIETKIAVLGFSLIRSNSPSSLNLIRPAATKGFRPSYFLLRAIKFTTFAFKNLITQAQLFKPRASRKRG